MLLTGVMILRFVRALHVVLSIGILLAMGVAFAQRGAIQVLGDPGLVIRVDGEIVGLTTSEPGGLLIMDVREGNRLVEALEAGRVVVTEIVSVDRGGVTVFEAADPWPIQFGTDGWDEVKSVAVDAAGTIYAAGSAYAEFGSNAYMEDGFVRVFGVQGRELWIHQFGTDGRDLVWSVAVDAAGTIYAAGLTNGSLGGPNAGGWNGFVRALDAQGHELWTHQFGTADWDEVSSVAVDAAGTIYAAGSTGGSLGAVGKDGFVRALDSQGRELWTHQFGTEETDHVSGVAVDTKGTIYAAGVTYGGSLGGPNAGKSDGFVRALDPQGRELWTHQFGTDSFDNVSSVAVDVSGTIYVAGDTDRSLGGRNAGSTDGFVRALDSQGRGLWTHQFGTAGDDGVWSVAVDAAGTIYAAGSTSGSLGGPYAGGGDGFVYRIPPIE